MPRVFMSPSSQTANLYTGGGNEETYMNLIADKICPELTRHGIEWKRNNPANDYTDHVNESNAYMAGYVGKKYHLALHSNAGGGHGCTSFCYHAEINNAGTQFATKLYNRIVAISPWAGRGVKSTTMDEVEKTDVPACLIEIEFHDNLEGANWIKANISNIAHALLLGILEQLDIAYIPPTPPVDYKALYEAEKIKNISLQAQLLSESTRANMAEAEMADLAVHIRAVQSFASTH